ncbi:MAG: molybdenum cofactor guanylyltransferase [Janthinobacterium lividum]
METALKGLVLAGGRSSRMGESKAEMNWHGKQQQYHLADLMASYCDDVFVSCRKDQTEKIQSEYKTIPDQYENAGPFEAILTAFEVYPDCAWMIMACDVPLLDRSTLDNLIEQRDQTKIATVFKSPWDGLPEPLTGIWETESYLLLKYNYQQEQISLRRLLIKYEAKIIKAPNTSALMNANTPEDAKQIRKILDKKNASFNT